MMATKNILLAAVMLFMIIIVCTTNCHAHNSSAHHSLLEKNKIVGLELNLERLLNQSKLFEKKLKDIIKGAVKNVLPSLMTYSTNSSVSEKCTASFMKFISGLMSTKTWALKMLDSTSKPPAGIFEGTLSDFGAFDQCRDIEVPSRNGNIEFRGQYCAVEARPHLPPIPADFSMVKQPKAEPMDSIGKYVWKTGSVFYYLKFRFGVCVPSSCTLEDMKNIVSKVGDMVQMEVEVPQCYVKEGLKIRTIHIVITIILAFLFILCSWGSLIEYQVLKLPEKDRNLSGYKGVILCFSFISNFRRMISPSKGSEEFKSLHGLKSISVAWVILGHTLVWSRFQLVRRPTIVQDLFDDFEFSIVLNSWLSVESFFFLSGLLTSYAILRLMPRFSGRLNVPVYILHRYLRLTPSLALVMGLAFFMPLISSGPFWYEVVDPELKSCTNYWWTSILFISNWFGMKNICIHPTWYLSAEFQLYLTAIVVISILYKFPRVGLSLCAMIIVVCAALVGVLTHLHGLPPIILISSGNAEQIQETIDFIHMKTFTHAGPYYVGIILGYLILKYRNIKLSKATNLSGWCLASVFALSSLYGSYQWNIGEQPGPILTAVFAAVHRTTFTISVAWVTFACITGHGGIVNRFLSSTGLAFLGRITYSMYLLHSLVMFVRNGSLRDRMFISHYNLLYEYVGNMTFTLILAMLLYLLLESPLTNLERLIFARRVSHTVAPAEQPPTGHAPQNLIIGTNSLRGSKEGSLDPKNVTLQSVVLIDDRSESHVEKL